MPEPEDLPFTHLHVASYMGHNWGSAQVVLAYLRDHKNIQRYLLKKILASRDTWFPLIYLTHPTFHQYLKLEDVVDDSTFLVKIEEGLKYEEAFVA